MFILISDMLHHTSDIVKKNMRSNERDRINVLAAKRRLLRPFGARNDEEILLVAELLPLRDLYC